jgi:hypothetical protein
VVVVVVVVVRASVVVTHMRKFRTRIRIDAPGELPAAEFLPPGIEVLILGRTGNKEVLSTYNNNQFSGFNDALGWQSLRGMTELNLRGCSLKGYLIDNDDDNDEKISARLLFFAQSLSSCVVC